MKYVRQAPCKMANITRNTLDEHHAKWLRQCQQNLNNLSRETGNAMIKILSQKYIRISYTGEWKKKTFLPSG